MKRHKRSLSRSERRKSKEERRKWKRERKEIWLRRSPPPRLTTWRGGEPTSGKKDPKKLTMAHGFVHKDSWVRLVGLAVHSNRCSGVWAVMEHSGHKSSVGPPILCWKVCRREPNPERSWERVDGRYKAIVLQMNRSAAKENPGCGSGSDGQPCLQQCRCEWRS